MKTTLMKRFLRNIIILLAPFLMIYVVNQLSIDVKKPNRTIILGVKTINHDDAVIYECTWYCHHSTQYCIDNHTHFLKPIVNFVNPIYFGIIHLLAATGNYGFANIIFLVILWPLFMYLLLIKCLDLRSKIKEKSRNG